MQFLKTTLILMIVALMFACAEDPYKSTKGSYTIGGGTGGGGTGGGGTGGGGTGGGGTGGGTGGGGTGGGGTGSGSGSGGTLSSWDRLSLGSLNSVTANGRGYDALIVYAPITKDEYYGSSAAGSVTLSSQKTSSAYAPEESNDYKNYNITASESTMSPEAAFHLSLRKLENEMLEKNLYKSTSSAETPVDHMPCNVGGMPFDIWDTRKNDGTKIRIKAVAKSEGKACYYSQTEESNDSLIDKVKTAFEGNIYEKVTSRFGSPSDVDGNGHINIVFLNMGGFNSGNLATGGYFSPGDLGPYSTTCGGGAVSRGCSNEADAIYINSNWDVIKNIDAAELVAHEFQHLTFNNKAKTSGSGSGNNNIWLNESLAMLSAYICGYGRINSVSERWLRDFFGGNSYHISLTKWTGDSSYGYVTIFAHYLYDVFGEEITNKIYENLSSSGIASVEAATSSAPELGGGDFNEIFKNFAQALYLSNTKLTTDRKFKITSIDLGQFTSGNGGRTGLKYKKTTTSGSSVTDEILPYSLSLINISGKINGLTIQAPDSDSWSAYGGPLN